MRGGRIAALLAAVIVAGLAGKTSAEPIRPTRVLYLVPADRAPKREYSEGIARGLLALQAWYRDQLGGKTFALSPQVVEVCRSTRPTAWFETNEAYLRVVDEIRACGYGGFDDPAARWVVYADLASPCKATWRLGAGGNGTTIMPVQDMQGLSGVEAIVDSCGATWRSGIGRWIGGVGHEMGHALGLPHPPGCDTGDARCDYGALMYTGYAVWPDTYFRDDEKLMLAGGWRAQPFLGEASVALASVNAASYASGVAPGALVAAFGSALATRTQAPATAECASTLADRQVFLRDAAGVEHRACLGYVGPQQINFRMPPEMTWRSKDGTPVPIPALVRIVDATTGADVALGTARLDGVAPGLFMAAEGRAAGYVVRVRDGAQSTEPIDAPIDLGPPGDRVYLILYGTGLRGELSRGNVGVTIGGTAARVEWSGPAPGYAGVEQINVLLPRELAGRGALDAVLSAAADGVPARASNKVRLAFR